MSRLPPEEPGRGPRGNTSQTAAGSVAGITHDALPPGIALLL